MIAQQQAELESTRRGTGSEGKPIPSSRQPSLILISGALSASGTGTDGGESGEREFSMELATGAEMNVLSQDPRTERESTQTLINTLRRYSGLTWEQIGELLGVSRRAVHFWASGKPLNRGNEQRLRKLVAFIRWVDRGDARANREAILSGKEGKTVFELLSNGDIAQARDALGRGKGRRHPTDRTSMSSAAVQARRPPAPNQLVDARSDRVHGDSGQRRPVKTVRNKKTRGDG